MMTAEQLKRSILQLAMQGKLVEQRPEEGTGEELYIEILSEKKRLIKEGKVKKKSLPDIIDSDTPFDIPDSWRWVRISEISTVINGDRGKNYPSKSTLSHKGIPFISALNLDGSTVVEDDSLLCVSQEQYDRLGSGKLEKGDIVVCIRGSLGKHGRYPFEKGAIASSLVICRQFIKNEITALFIMSFLDAPLFFEQIKQYDNGTAQPNLAAKSLERFFIPLPPLAEQKRIVAKIEELMPFVDQYAAASTKLNTLNASFPEMMKKSILQEAVQGKLVPQDPNDEPASLLLKKIAEEQQELIKSRKLRLSGKINKTSEIELNIPDTWEKAKLKDLIAGKVDNRGKTPLHNSFRDDEYCIDLLEINSLVPGQYITHANVEKFITKEIYDSLRGHIRKDDILIATVGSLGKFSLMDDTVSGIAQNIIAIRFCKGINPRFVFYLLQSPYFEASMSAIKMEAVQASIKVPDLFNLIVPLPPTEEQNRIVDKVDEIMTPIMNELDRLKHQ